MTRSPQTRRKRNKMVMTRKNPNARLSSCLLVSLFLLLLHRFEVVEGLITSSLTNHKINNNNVMSIVCSSSESASPPQRRQRRSFLLLAATDSDSPSKAEEEEEEIPFVPKYTGLDKHITWKLANPPVPIQSERALLQSGTLLRRGEFSRAEGRRVDEIEMACHNVGMTLDQGFLIRKQMAVTKVMKNSWKLREAGYFYSRLESKFGSTKQTLQELSRAHDLPPVSILRTILRKRMIKAYPDMRQRDRDRQVKTIISEEAEPAILRQFLSPWEIRQLQKAKEVDVIGYSATNPTIESNKWENAIYKFLDERGINYMTEEDMRLAGSKITPDCLLLDNCLVNDHGEAIRWIDAKNFYGSGLNECRGIRNKMKKQIAKYEDEFGGCGAIVFKHGFSETFIESFPSTLFLDSGPVPF